MNGRGPAPPRVPMAGAVACAAALLAGAVALAFPPPAAAQQYGGSMTVGGDGYLVDGREARRPGLMGRTTFSPYMDLWGIRLGMQVTYDTESDFAARSLNRYGLEPTWSWGRLQLGDHVPRLDDLVLAGTTLRGVGVELTPGRVRLRLHGGRADDAVLTDPLGFGAVDDRPFDVGGHFALRREVFGGAFRVGSDATHVEFLALHAADARDVPDTVAVSPQRNLIVGLAAAVEPRPFWRLEGRVLGSVHSRDTRKAPLEGALMEEEFGRIGRWIDRVHPVRPGTSSDLAFRVQLQAPLPWGRLRLRVEEIGPGYTSLGIPSLPQNWRNVDGNVSFTAAGGTLGGTVGGGWRKDGLVDPGAGPTHRLTGTTALSWQPGPAFGLSGNLVVNQLERRAAVDTLAMVNVARSMSLSSRWTPGGESRHTLSMSLSAQESETTPGVLAPYGSRSGTLALGWDLRLTETFSSGFSPGVVASRDDGGSTTSYTASVTAGYRPAETPLSATGSLSVGQTLVGFQTQASTNLRYDAGPFGTVTFRLRGTNFSGETAYREMTASLALSRGF